MADSLGHRLPVPKRLQHWICDKFDRSLGMYDDDENDVWYPLRSGGEFDRWREPHDFVSAKEHEFCSWCSAPEGAPCHEAGDSD